MWTLNYREKLEGISYKSTKLKICVLSDNCTELYIDGFIQLEIEVLAN